MQTSEQLPSKEDMEQCKQRYLQKLTYRLPENYLQIEQQIRNILDKYSFGLRFWLKDLTNILVQNKFRNQMDPMSSVGSGAKIDRFKTMYCNFNYDYKRISGKLGQLDGIVINNKTNKKVEWEDLEIYGFLFDENDQIQETSRYGDVQVKFKKENLKNRTTYSMGDSLWFTNSGSGIIRHFNDASILAFPFNRWNMLKELKTIQDCHVCYIELQYHGGVSLQDVESFKIYSDVAQDQKKWIQKICDKRKISVSFFNQ